MMVLNYVFPVLSVLMGLVCYVGGHKHLLSALLSLEFIMLNIFWFMLNCLVFVGAEIYFCLFFLTLVACEGALGLGLMVCMSRSHGGDKFNSLSSLQC